MLAISKIIDIPLIKAYRLIIPVTNELLTKMLFQVFLLFL